MENLGWKPRRRWPPLWGEAGTFAVSASCLLLPASQPSSSIFYSLNVHIPLSIFLSAKPNSHLPKCYEVSRASCSPTWSTKLSIYSLVCARHASLLSSVGLPLQFSYSDTLLDALSPPSSPSSQRLILTAPSPETSDTATWLAPLAPPSLWSDAALKRAALSLLPAQHSAAPDSIRCPGFCLPPPEQELYPQLPKQCLVQGQVWKLWCIPH